ncbi:FadR/GntR family transcriptional regulator [Cupriavidus sp. H39]|uniref:FadR/GntR family transcriptional regulator n=1 Tax=Cupriavidus sp. H39 TaxID=3401635 RepID=UPI003D027E8E
MSSLQAVTAQRLYRLIADQIARKIAAGYFPPGARLPAERELAEQLNVARSTVREALIALEIGGFVEVRVGSGVFVVDTKDRPPVPNDARLIDVDPEVPSWHQGREMSPFELLETRALVEPECAALAAINASGDQLSAIEEAHRKMDPTQSPEASDFAHDRALHEAIASASGNTALASVVMHIWQLCEASALFKGLDKHFIDAGDYRQAIDEHSRVVAAIIARDPIRARHAMSYHLLAITARASREVNE